MSDRGDSPQVIVEHYTSSVSSFLKGAILGAGVALLFAPRQGRQLRDMIAGELEDLRDRLRGRVDEAQRSFSGRVEEVRRDVRSEFESRVRGSRHGREEGDLRAGESMDARSGTPHPDRPAASPVASPAPDADPARRASGMAASGTQEEQDTGHLDPDRPESAHSDTEPA